MAAAAILITYTNMMPSQSFEKYTINSYSNTQNYPCKR